MADAKTGYLNNEFMTANGVGSAMNTNKGDRLKDDDFAYLKPLQLSRRQLELMAPFISGRAIFVPIKQAEWMVEAYPKESKQFSQLLLTCTTRFEIFTDMTAELGTVDTGNEGQAYDYHAKTTGAIIRECSLTLPAENYDGFITSYQSAWINGNGSGVDNVAELGGTDGLPTAARMSMEGIYIVLDPSERKVVKAVYMTNMLPKNSPNTIFNATKGEYAHQEVTLQYGCHGIQGDANVNKIAQEYIDSLNSKRNHDKRLSGDTFDDMKIEKGETII